jgi:hypothetical protein
VILFMYFNYTIMELITGFNKENKVDQRFFGQVNALIALINHQYKVSNGNFPKQMEERLTNFLDSNNPSQNELNHLSLLLGLKSKSRVNQGVVTLY